MYFNIIQYKNELILQKVKKDLIQLISDSKLKDALIKLALVKINEQKITGAKKSMKTPSLFF